MCCCRQEAERLPFVGDLEPILALQQGTYSLASAALCKAYAESGSHLPVASSRRYSP